MNMTESTGGKNFCVKDCKQYRQPKDKEPKRKASEETQRRGETIAIENTGKG